MGCSSESPYITSESARANPGRGIPWGSCNSTCTLPAGEVESFITNSDPDQTSGRVSNSPPLSGAQTDTKPLYLPKT